ncbi:hypothetical protein C8J56DRAFT_1052172 [Mycena floridula]|nr:hypothetical protein C8J56DRAFT_1052172 [Mycena floridula]
MPNPGSTAIGRISRSAEDLGARGDRENMQTPTDAVLLCAPLSLFSLNVFMGRTRTKGKGHVAQKRPRERACDSCRRRKLKCEIPKRQLAILASPKCTHCTKHRISCTFEMETNRPPATRKAYIVALETRVMELEEILERYASNTDYSHVLGAPIIIGSWVHGGFKTSRDGPKAPRRSVKIEPVTSVSDTCSKHLIFDSVDVGDPSSEDDDVDDCSLLVRGKEHDSLIEFFHGLSIRKAFADTMRRLSSDLPRHLWETYWWGAVPTDDNRILQAAAERFPEPDLADNLFELYFERVNVSFCLLHRASTMRNWMKGLQYIDKWFACVCHAIFGIASRWSDDPRVLPSDEVNPNWTRSGWTYFRGAMGVIHAAGVSYQPSLHEVQGLALTALFLSGSEMPTTTCVLINTALRKCISIGAHRKSSYGIVRTVDEELWKRAFWLLSGNAILGRAPSIGEEDFDIEFSTEVDDEFWENTDPSWAFSQPRNIRPRSAVFNHWTRLMRIATFALKTIYVVSPRGGLSFQKFMPSKAECARQCTAAMQAWFKNIPEHLIWSENIEDLLESNHSAWLHASYCLVEMLVYRPFIPSPAAADSGSQALDICINAATAAARIFAHQMKRGYWQYTNLLCTSEVGAAILIIGIWDAKRKGKLEGLDITKGPIREIIHQFMMDLDIFFLALKGLERRFDSVTPILNRLRESLPTELQYHWQGYDSNRTHVHSRSDYGDEYEENCISEPHRGETARPKAPISLQIPCSSIRETANSDSYSRSYSGSQRPLYMETSWSRAELGRRYLHRDSGSPDEYFGNGRTSF